MVLLLLVVQSIVVVVMVMMMGLIFWSAIGKAVWADDSTKSVRFRTAEMVLV